MELQLQSGSCDCQTGAAQSASLNFVEVCLCRFGNHGKVDEPLAKDEGKKKTKNLVKERANGDNCEKQQVCGYFYL